MRILSIQHHSKKEIVQETVKVLSFGGVVVYPTETTYGIGVSAVNQAAVDKLLLYKKRRRGKPFSIAVCDQKMAEKYVSLNKTARNIYKTFLPGPVTVISKSKERVAKGVESERKTLGIRIPNDPLIVLILRELDLPITATGANASYKKRPYSVKDILDNISEKQKNLIDLVLDAGELPHNDPSTVIDTTLDEPSILRQGEILFKESLYHTSHSPKETQQLGRKLIQKYRNLFAHRPIIFALKGEMGVGKTQFVKGIAQGLEIARVVSSPTYVLAKEYRFNAEGESLRFIHVDAWRMLDEEELEALGFSSWLSLNNVVAIEWAEKAMMTIQTKHQRAKIVWVKIAYGKNEQERILKYSS